MNEKEKIQGPDLVLEVEIEKDEDTEVHPLINLIIENIGLDQENKRESKDKEEVDLEIVEIEIIVEIGEDLINMNKRKENFHLN